jgi:His/Glu/Gln/Arg/opine family amino acid ABC transporter permease subunit
MYDFLFVLLPRYMPFLLEGAVTTIQISVLSMAAAIVIGLLVALGRLSRRPVLSSVLATYVEIWRNVPLIVQLLVIYFSLPQFGISLSGFSAGVLGLSLNVGAYLSEVFRAAILSVDNGQRDAGLSIGMSRFRIYQRVILPQALRIAIPTIGGYFIALLKDSALVSYIAVNELLRHGTIVISNTFKSMEIYIMVAVVYFVISFISARFVAYIERSLTPTYLRTAKVQP